MLATVQQTFNGANPFPIGGRYFRLLSTVNPVDVKLGRGLKLYEKMDQVEAGAWYLVPDGQDDFSDILITTGASELVKFVVTDGTMGYDRLFATLVQVATMANEAEATVGAAAALVLAAANNRKKIVFRALGSNTGNIALGASGLTIAAAAIVLAPGDEWIETDAAPAAWYAISEIAAQKLEILSASS
jgi:hypothetical protein